mgnify:CR=1 FL=1
MMLVANQTRKGDCMMKSIVEEKLVSFKTLEQKAVLNGKNIFACHMPMNF